MVPPIDPHKISEKEQRRAARIKERLINQGVGEDEAQKRAIEEAVQELRSGQGGGKNAGG